MVPVAHAGNALGMAADGAKQLAMHVGVPVMPGALSEVYAAMPVKHAPPKRSQLLAPGVHDGRHCPFEQALPMSQSVS